MSEVKKFKKRDRINKCNQSFEKANEIDKLPDKSGRGKRKEDVKGQYR